LTIAQDLVSRNGGLIEFTSKPGRTAFQVLLPVGGANGAKGVPPRSSGGSGDRGGVPA
jgi:nitrogen-specific signal transduction histidine kinase